jgi:drug/metabolite transporter (DMT)-like permease
MPAVRTSTPPNETARLAYQQALLRTRPRWQTLLFLFAGFILSFVVPGIALCGQLPQSGIVWAITGTALATGLGYCAVSRLLERSSSDNRRVDDLLLSGILMIAAGLLWAEIAVQSGPVRGRTLEFWPSLAIVLLAGFAGAFLMQRRAARLASIDHTTISADGVRPCGSDPKQGSTTHP